MEIDLRSQKVTQDMSVQAFVFEGIAQNTIGALVRTSFWQLLDLSTTRKASRKLWHL